MRRILVGVDGSDASLEALGWSVRLARACGARVVVVHGLVFPVSEIKPETAQRLRAEQADQLTGWAAAVVGDVPHDLEVRPGDPRDAIPAAAREHDADLVVVASSGATGRTPGFLHLGSVAEYLAHHVERPLAIVPPSPPVPLDRLVVAVDGSEPGRAATRWAADLAASVAATVTAVAVDEPRAPIAGVADDADDETWRQAAVEVVRDDWAEPLTARDVAADVVVLRQGPVPEAILDTAAIQRADAVVIGRGASAGSPACVPAGWRSPWCTAQLPVVMVPPVDAD